MTSNEFLEQKRRIEHNYNQTFSEEQLKLWWEEFKSVDIGSFTKAIDKTISSCKFMPKIADVKNNITARRMNLNSSYWYANLKDIRPYFDITTGEPLEPFN